MAKKRNAKKRTGKRRNPAQGTARMQAQQPRRRWVFPLVCYAVAIAVYLLACVFTLVGDNARIGTGAIAQSALRLTDFTQLNSVQVLEEEDGRERFVSTDGDPQLIYAPEGGFYATRFEFAAEANRPGGEIVAYYTTQPGQDFSEAQKLWAQRTASGSWVFDFGGRKLYSLRLDPSTSDTGVLWTVEHMTLNAPKPVPAYFVPDARPLVALAVLPLFAAALLTALWALMGRTRDLPPPRRMLARKKDTT